MQEGYNLEQQLTLLKYAVYVAAGLYVSWRVLAPSAALPYEVMWIVSNPVTKILLLLAIYACVSKEPIAAILLTSVYILTDYDLYISGKYYSQ